MSTRWADFRRLLWLQLVLILMAGSMWGDSAVTKDRTVTKLGEGIYEIRHPDAPDTFPQSNTTVIIGEKSVLVVDSCLLPSTTRQDIDQIRKWTNKPVTYLLNTHWHFDHTLGNATYAAEFPEIQIIAQTATQKTIADFNPGAVTRYPSRAQRFQKVLDSGKNPDGTPCKASTPSSIHAPNPKAPTACRPTIRRSTSAEIRISAPNRPTLSVSSVLTAPTRCCRALDTPVSSCPCF